MMDNSNDKTNPTPPIARFESVALQANMIRFSIRVDIPEGYVILVLISQGTTDDLQVEAGYTFYHRPEYDDTAPALSEKPGRSLSSMGSQSGSESYMWFDESIANSLHWLVEDWGHGEPDFDSIKIETKKSPVKGAELKQLILAVCLEAFGREVPGNEDLVDRVKQTQKKHKDLRSQCFEWLQNGSAGIANWNQLRVDEREAVGNLGKCQLSNRDLRNVRFGNQDLRGSDFREASLQGARFGGADCRDVDFSGANLSETWLSGAKLLHANFSNALCRDATIRAADCRNAIFTGTNLSNVDLSFTDLRGVDLSSAKLDGVQLFRVMYDEQTRFPRKFVAEPELEMQYKGSLQRGPEYKTDAPLDELLTLIPPPVKPAHTAGDWAKIETELGVVFPDDFKHLIASYGSGRFFNDLNIFNPLTSQGRESITTSLEMLEDLREACEYLWPIHPEEAGILPWGDDSNGNYFCWLAGGEPNDWPTGQLGHDADEPESDHVNIVTFLLNYARNQYPEMQGGLTFEKSDLTFSTT
ncbi:MAG: pentapeptide repeat-containing protein [bacterium]|nr:pentapeptide repeat-containing protein [bacterium]